MFFQIRRIHSGNREIWHCRVLSKKKKNLKVCLANWNHNDTINNSNCCLFQNKGRWHQQIWFSPATIILSGTRILLLISAVNRGSRTGSSSAIFKIIWFFFFQIIFYFGIQEECRSLQKLRVLEQEIFFRNFFLFVYSLAGARLLHDC